MAIANDSFGKRLIYAYFLSVFRTVGIFELRFYFNNKNLIRRYEFAIYFPYRGAHSFSFNDFTWLVCDTSAILFNETYPAFQSRRRKLIVSTQ